MKIKSFFNKNDLYFDEDSAKEGLIQFINYVLSEITFKGIKENNNNFQNYTAIREQLTLLQQSVRTIDQNEKISFTISHSRGEYLKEESLEAMRSFFIEILRIEKQYSLRLRNSKLDLDSSDSEIRQQVLKEIIDNLTTD